MKKFFASLLMLISGGFAVAQMGPANPISWSHSLSGGQLEMVATSINDNWYIYDLGPYDGGPNPTSFRFDLPEGVTLNGPIVELTTPTHKMDEMFGMEIGHYGPVAKFRQGFVNNSGTAAKVEVTVEWQACDKTSCIAPDEHYFTIELPVGAGVGDKVATASSVPLTKLMPATVVENPAQKKSSRSLWSVILEAIIWGFAALLTPCVFPMVPMTVSFFIKGSGSKARGRFMAMIYGLSIVALYTLPIAAIIGISYFGGGEAVTADIFNWLATHWVPNILFFLVFMVFAASFFGAFEITMPSRLVNKSDQAADKGGLVGVFFMALTLVLVSFSCTGPIVGTVIVNSTQGEIWEPIITMLAFSAAFALPFTVFALFPSLLKNLPKSGGWLNSVKVVLGFIELALGLKFLSVADQTYHWGLLDREVYLALWIVIFTLLGLYLLGKLRFAHDSKTEYVSVKRLFMAIVSFSFVVYLIPGMWGAPLRALSGYLPPLSTHDFVVTRGSVSSTGAHSGGSVDMSLVDGGEVKHSSFLHLPEGLDGFFDFEQGMTYARKVNKPVMLDFTGHGCVNCREMEANVLSMPEVVELLSREYVIIALYNDDRTELPENEWVTNAAGRTLKTIGRKNAAWQIERFGVNAQPYYVLLNPQTDTELSQPRSYDLSVPGFVEFLQNGVKAYEAQR